MINLDNLDRMELHPTADVLRTLAMYCDHREIAMRFRAAGNVKVAQSAEAACEAIYAGLPEWAKW